MELGIATVVRPSATTGRAREDEEEGKTAGPVYAGLEETTEHVLFVCPRFRIMRDRMLAACREDKTLDVKTSLAGIRFIGYHTHRLGST